MLFIKTQIVIAKPVDMVFEAIIDPKQLSHYFVSSASARLEEGRMVLWTWDDYNAKHEVCVDEVKPNRLISFKWSATGFETKVAIHLEQKEDKTIVKVVEESWPEDEAGIRAFGENSQGWMHFLLCLKAYLEHGINLRK